MKIGRNDNCPCGSGKKYKKCCLKMAELDIDGNQYTAYAVMSEGYKYHSSFVLINPNEKKLLEIRDYNKEHLKKDDVEVVEYFTSQSKKLITDVVNGLHNTMLDNSEVLLVDVNNPYDIQVLEGIQKAKQKLKEKAGKSLN